MNKKNVTALRDFMSNLPRDRFDITGFFDIKEELLEDTDADDFCDLRDKMLEGDNMIHNCGTTACVAGWTAVMPAFIKDAGKQDEFTPTIKTEEYGSLEGAAAMAYWLDISVESAEEMCWLGMDSCKYYGVERDEDISPEVVVAKLNEILLDESLTFEW